MSRWSWIANAKSKTCQRAQNDPFALDNDEKTDASRRKMVLDEDYEGDSNVDIG